MRLGNKKSVAVVIVTFKNPDRVRNLLRNIWWSGVPDCPIYVFEDPIPGDPVRRADISAEYYKLCTEFNVRFDSAPSWGCMQGITEYAMRNTDEDWIIWVPDDVLFTKGTLLNEYSAIQKYGEDYVGGIQAAYWNAEDLIKKGLMKDKSGMFDGWIPDNIPENVHWNACGKPRCYVNLNGAGFSFNRKLWQAMGGFPPNTWRLDEYAGFKAWQLGYVCITNPGPPRIHYFGGSTAYSTQKHDFHMQDQFEHAIGMNLYEANIIARSQMAKIPATEPDGSWDDIKKFFDNGGSLVS